MSRCKPLEDTDTTGRQHRRRRRLKTLLFLPSAPSISMTAWFLSALEKSFTTDLKSATEGFDLPSAQKPPGQQTAIFRREIF